MSYDRMKTREDILLTRYLNARKDAGEKKLDFNKKWKESKRIKAKWTQQWGNLKTEANLWWLDDEERARRRGAGGQKTTWYHSIGPNWKQIMGQHWYQWFLPLGRSYSDGLTYNTNWRFGEGGLWRPRETWAGKDSK
jgi:palmitoyltransferase